MKARSPVRSSKMLPITPPIMLALRNIQKRRLWPLKSLSCARIPPINPGHSATVFVTFAVIGGTPRASSVGKVIKVPPPASALIAPAATAANPNQP